MPAHSTRPTSRPISWEAWAAGLPDQEVVSLYRYVIENGGIARPAVKRQAVVREYHGRFGVDSGGAA